MNLEEFGPDAKDEMSPSDYIQYCMEKYREYRILSTDPTITDQAYKLYSDKAMEYYVRAQEAMDEIEPDNTDHLSDEDKALPNVPLGEKDEELSDRDKAMVDDYEEEEANREVPRDYASMYENETKNNKMENINLNRWAKLAGINENEELGNESDFNIDWNKQQVVGVGEDGGKTWIDFKDPELNSDEDFDFSIPKSDFETAASGQDDSVYDGDNQSYSITPEAAKIILDKIS